MSLVQRTYSLKAGDLDRKWILIDAENAISGRLASYVAQLLRGKHKPSYTPHMDCGDSVIIINAAKVAMTGRKLTDKTYYRHTGYPGGIRSTTPEKILESKHPERILQKAIERMMPRGPLAREQLRHLRIYGGAEHPHQGRKPEPLDFKALNPKNTFRSEQNPSPDA